MNNNYNSPYLNDGVKRDSTASAIFENREILTDLSNSGLVKMFHDM